MAKQKTKKYTMSALRGLEIVLKLAFLVDALFIMGTGTLLSQSYLLLAGICLLLGIVLVFNRDGSYHYKLSERGFRMRQVEGVLLVLFSILVNAGILSMWYM